MYTELIEQLMSEFAAKDFAEEVLEAKREFFDRAGILDELATDYEMKMSQFVDWYLFIRPLKNKGMTPIDVAVTREGATSEALTNLKNSIHSLFEFIKVKNEDVYVRDVFSGEKYIIKKSPITLGFNRDELFQARLIPTGDSFQFSNAFCFHPAAVAKIMLKEVKKVRRLDVAERPKAKEELLVRWFKLRYKHEQYKHVDVRDVYSPDSKLRI